MRILGLLLLALIFAVTPFYLLSFMVTPQLTQMQQVYEHADEIAAQVAQP
jgi:hypothetical protein